MARLTLGPHPDTRMGAALAPEVLPATLRLGREYRLPPLMLIEAGSYLGGAPPR